MLTSADRGATVKPTPGARGDTPEEIMLKTIEDLSARWHRHPGQHDLFTAGMRAAWAQSIGLLLGTPTSVVEAALDAGVL